jgi:hypothetical protein
MTMPILEAKEFYDNSPFVDRSGDYPSFLHFFDAYAVYGYVLSTPDIFICARPVDSKALPSLIDDPVHTFPPDQCDCWFIALMAGDLSKLWGYYPVDLPLTMWYNDGRRYVVPMKLIRRKLTFTAQEVSGSD